MSFWDYFRQDTTDTKEDGYERSSSSGIATRGDPDRDPLAAQKPTSPTELSDQSARDIYEGNMLARAMVDNISEDMVRKGWEFDSENEDLNDTVNDQMAELGTQDKIQATIEDDLIYGDGYTGIGLSQSDLDISAPVENPQTIQDVEFLTQYDHEDITNHKVANGNNVGMDLESQRNYGKIMAYEINGLGKDVHRDRMLHLQMRPRKDDDEGMSFFLDKQLLLQVFDNALWSVGQSLYQLAFKVIYTDMQGMDKEDVKKMRSRLETDLNVLTAFTLDKGRGDEKRDEIEFPSISQNISGLGDMLEWIEDVMSMASKQPLSRLFGNQAGTVSGADEDTRGYYDRISSMQQSYLKPLLRKLTKYILWSNDVDPESLEWEIEFNPLWEYDEQTEAEIELIKSKKWLNHFKIGSVNGGYVAEQEGFDTSALDQSLPDNFDLPEVDEGE